MIQAYKNKQISKVEFGNLSSERDYIGIEDAATQLIAIAERGTLGEVYNVGSGLPKTMRSLLIEMLSKDGISGDVIVEASSESVGRKGFDVPRIYADISKVASIQNN